MNDDKHRMQELYNKSDRAGLTPAEREELKRLQSSGRASTPRRPAAVNVERIRQRNAGRALAKQAIGNAGDSLCSACAETRAGFVEAVREFLAEIDPTPKTDAAPMTSNEAYEFESGVMQFGQYKGRRLADIPLKYLDWLVGQKDNFRLEIARYLKNGGIAEKLRAELEDQ